MGEGRQEVETKGLEVPENKAEKTYLKKVTDF